MCTARFSGSGGGGVGYSTSSRGRPPCENITLPQTSFPGGNNKKTYREAIWFDALWCVDIARNWDRHRNRDRHRYRQMSTESNGNLCWHLSLYSMNTFLSVPLSVSVSGNANTS